MPHYLGHHELKPLGVIAIGLTPCSLTSENGEAPPFWCGLQYDPSPEGRQRNIEATIERNTKKMAYPNDNFPKYLATAGVSWEGGFMWDSVSILPDRFVQMSTPALKYPRSYPENFRWGGPIPRGPRSNVTHPSWWGNIAQANKPVIMVYEGTVPGLTFINLIVPTIEALASEDVLVVAILGTKGASLPSGVVIPTNARVIDHIPYDDVLEHAKVFVTNGGNGSFQQALLHGVPMVIAGEAQDKAEVAWRADYAGVALNLKTERPTQDAITMGVREILRELRYKSRAEEIREEMQTYNAFEAVAANIEELSATALQLIPQRPG
jgi:UDP:flavonoid glycosyltransferase YjiC (YdhE family)